MVFCCIAIVAVAIVYFIVLWVRQVFTRPHQDLLHSTLPSPPRALTGNNALPVYGHTNLFTELGGDIYHLFERTWREIPFIHNNRISRQLGECFAIFIWGQWRVIVQGPQRVQKILQQSNLKESWPWTPPITLLGKSCLSFLEDSTINTDNNENGNQAIQLRAILTQPLSHEQVLQHAPVFADFAEQCLDRLQNGNFSHKHNTMQPITAARSKHPPKSPMHDNKLCRSRTPWRRKPNKNNEGIIFSNSSSDSDDHNNKNNNNNNSTSDKDDSRRNDNITRGNETWSVDPTDVKLKWEALRSYTLDLVDGPVLNLQLLDKSGTNAQLRRRASYRESILQSRKKREPMKHPPSRELLLTWMERMKIGVDTIKITFGPEWMYIWTMNEYGRALNARMYLEGLVRQHVSKLAMSMPVTRKRGHSYHEPSTQPIPIWTMRENMLRDQENIFGASMSSHHSSSTSTSSKNTNRPRSNSMPLASLPESSPQKINFKKLDIERPRKSRANSDCVSIELTKQKDYDELVRSRNSETKNSLMLAVDVDSIPEGSTPKIPKKSNEKIKSKSNGGTKSKQRIKVASVLESILEEKNHNERGMTEVVCTEIGLLLWLMLDVGNAWTAMALTLLAFDNDACCLVQEEIDLLEMEFGYAKLCTPAVLNKMPFVDALLYEAIRLTPANLGGLKETTETVEFRDIGVQVAKGTQVVFCQATEQKFDIRNGLGKKPECLGTLYPCLELHGFMPLQGLEVPLMVLQSKMFLIYALRRYTPHVQEKKTLLRRVKRVVSDHIVRHLGPEVNGNTTAATNNNNNSEHDYSKHDEECPSSANDSTYISQTQAMDLFTKIPFPEPKRVIYLRPRSGSSMT